MKDSHGLLRGWGLRPQPLMCFTLLPRASPLSQVSGSALCSPPALGCTNSAYFLNYLYLLGGLGDGARKADPWHFFSCDKVCTQATLDASKGAAELMFLSHGQSSSSVSACVCAHGYMCVCVCT